MKFHALIVLEMMEDDLELASSFSRTLVWNQYENWFFNGIVSYIFLNKKNKK
jgi:hypothetical protein